MNKNKIKIIWKYIKPYKISFSMLFICITVISLISMMYPFLLGMMINEILYYKNIRFFTVVGIIYVVLFLGERVFHFIQSNIWTYLTTKFLFDIRKDLFEKTITAKANMLSDIRTGDLMWVIDGDTHMFMELIHMNIFHMFNTLVRFILSIIFVFSINYQLAILMFVIVPATVYISMFISKKVKSKYSEYRKKYGDTISWVYEILNGVREIQLTGGERNVTWHFVKKFSELIRLKISTSYIELFSERAISLISVISDLCLYVMSGLLIVSGNFTIGGFIATIEYFNKANLALKNLNEVNVRIQNNMVSIDRVLNVLSSVTEQERMSFKNIKIPKGQIEFLDVLFSYDDKEFVLNNFNLKIKAGEKLAVVGRSGVGKSTMVSLLTGLYNPSKGMIKIDGTDISECSLKSLRKNIGIVQQDVLMFDGTIRYNLCLANANCNEREIWEACEKAYADEFIRNLPDGLDTIIGQNGVNLSGGQKQRIAIARIILKNPKILIFDEATSALDTITEKMVQSAWEDLSKGRTTIIIAHRLSTILGSDRVAVIHEGKTISCDHHLVLLENCEFYKGLFYEQYFGVKECV